MCGIAGFLGPFSKENKSNLQLMLNSIQHRGPDGEGSVHLDLQGAQLSFGHRRLAILELSEAGSQPMHSASGRYLITFNGEIYNHKNLRKELRETFRGMSDTETLLAGFEAWGITKTLQKSAGMFAMAVWDKEKQILFLARDRLGEKPLYFGKQGESFLFASELKALRKHPSFEGKLNPSAMENFLRYSFVPGPMSIYQGIEKLIPGTIMEIKKNGEFSAPMPYWNLSELAHQPQKNISQNTLEETLLTVLREQSTADVPVGTFLSGGIDSSLITALLSKEKKVNSFSIGFSESNANEAQKAKSIAHFLGTDHTELDVTGKDALEIIPKLPNIYDEPFADASQIPTILLCQLTRKHITVALSGDGGDELFAGYNRYTKAIPMWNTLSFIPHPIREKLSHFDKFIPSIINKINFPQPEEKLKKIFMLTQAKSIREVYWQLVSAGIYPASPYIQAEKNAWSLPPLEAMQYLDQIFYLPDDILVKVDRASMSVGLECRAPFLDPRIIALSWEIPSYQKINKGQGKIPLRNILNKYVPEKLWHQPKSGFTPPLDEWLRGPLHDWANELLSSRSLSTLGLPPQNITALWQKHTKKRGNYGLKLWPVLMAQSWLRSLS